MNPGISGSRYPKINIENTAACAQPRIQCNIRILDIGPLADVPQCTLARFSAWELLYYAWVPSDHITP